jgi:hypothetical protein
MRARSVTVTGSEVGGAERVLMPLGRTQVELIEGRGQLGMSGMEGYKRGGGPVWLRREWEEMVAWWLWKFAERLSKSQLKSTDPDKTR